jgi:hypothetical protein
METTYYFQMEIFLFPPSVRFQNILCFNLSPKAKIDGDGKKKIREKTSKRKSKAQKKFEWQCEPPCRSQTGLDFGLWISDVRIQGFSVF